MNRNAKSLHWKKRDRHIAGALRAICELMRESGIDRKGAESKLLAALDLGYAGRSNSSDESQRFTRLCDVCARWHLEKHFVDSRGKPRPLAWNGQSGELLRLVSKVVGAKPARDVIDQLIEAGHIKKVSGNSWVPKSRVLAPIGKDEATFARSATMVGQLLRTILHNSARRYRGDVLLEVMAQVPRLPKSSVHGFRRFAKAQGVSFIKTIDDWLESRNLGRKAQSKLGSTEAGVVAFAFHR